MLPPSVNKRRVPEDVAPLVDAIKARVHPVSIWLFGSRARGDHHAKSDWDLVITLPDDAPADLFDPILGWTIQRDVGIRATILTVLESDLIEGWGTPNTLSYELAREGQRLDV